MSKLRFDFTPDEASNIRWAIESHMESLVREAKDTNNCRYPTDLVRYAGLVQEAMALQKVFADAIAFHQKATKECQP